MPATRRSARVILLSPDRAVLLIQFVVQRSDGAFSFWATPGGEVESGESDHAAAQRELAEEVALTLPLEGPVHFASSTFEYNGEMVAAEDVFFTSRCSREAPQLHRATAEERDVLRQLRWWSADEITGSTENIFPPDLADVVRRLTA